MKLCLAVRWFGILLPLMLHGTVTGDVRLKKDGAIEIVGKISQSDVARLDTLLKNAKSTVHIWLSSNGGELLPAMQMGRLIRGRAAWTAILGPASCASACVFLLAAGVNRATWLDANVGIHRPSFPPGLFANLNSSDATRLYSSLAERCRAYLKEMGMADSLLEEMLKVPSGDIRWLKKDDLWQFGLEGTDPAWAEWVRALNIKKFGLAEVEREERAIKCIQETDDSNTCVKLHGSPDPPGKAPRLVEPTKVPPAGASPQ
jgi:ATP-dependent protease ClpP protease subunit